jgi:two-component system, OmpR family, response regulator
MKVLLVEDDSQVAETVAQGLRMAGKDVEIASSAREGLFRVGAENYDVIILDRIMPGLDGMAMIKLLRSAGVRTPVLMLTAIGATQDRVDGLEAGADDYLIKPFAFAELFARVNALARRPNLDHGEAMLRLGDLELDLLKGKMRRGAQEIALQPTELRLLEQFMRRPGEVLSREMLLQFVWEMNVASTTNVVEVSISRLRRKLDTQNAPPLIHTVRGAGYVLRVPN